MIAFRLFIYFILGFLLAAFAQLSFATDCPTEISACNAHWTPYTCQTVTPSATGDPTLADVWAFNNGVKSYYYGACTVATAPVCPGAGTYTTQSIGAPPDSTCLANGCSATSTDYIGTSGTYLTTWKVSSSASCLPASGALSAVPYSPPATGTDQYGNPVPSGGSCPSGFGLATVSGSGTSSSYCLPNGSSLTTKSSTSGQTKSSTANVDSNGQVTTSNSQSGQYNSAAPATSSGTGLATSSTPDVCLANPNSVMCADASSPDNSNLMVSQDIPVSDSAGVVENSVINSGSGTLPAGVGVCPLTDKSISILSSSVTLPFSQACSFLDLVRPVVMFVSYIMAGLILLRRS